jgi:hypothetical protein
MRLSIEDLKDPAKSKLVRTCEVTLDGKIVKCIEADEENGFVVVYTGVSEQTQKLHGTVKINFPLANL